MSNVLTAKQVDRYQSEGYLVMENLLSDGEVSRVFFTGLTIHGSYANRSADRPRNTFATHYVREGTWLFRRDVQETMAVEGAAQL